MHRVRCGAVAAVVGTRGVGGCSKCMYYIYRFTGQAGIDRLGEVQLDSVAGLSRRIGTCRKK